VLAEIKDNLPLDKFLRCAARRSELKRIQGLLVSAARGKRLYKCTTILDLDGVEYGTLYSILDYIKALNKYADLYPETAYKAIVINVPWMVRGIWSLIKMWLHPITAAKVHLVGEDYRSTFDENGLAGFNIPTPSEALSWHSVIDELDALPELFSYTLSPEEERRMKENGIDPTKHHVRLKGFDFGQGLQRDHQAIEVYAAPPYAGCFSCFGGGKGKDPNNEEPVDAMPETSQPGVTNEEVSTDPSLAGHQQHFKSRPSRACCGMEH